MDTELTLHELERLEAQRKLRDLPAALVETAWVREAQIEAVIDAVLVVALGADGHCPRPPRRGVVARASPPRCRTARIRRWRAGWAF
jgi:hypothetical protein